MMHTADQYVQYGSKVVPVTLRDATVVLDEIVGNETDLRILSILPTRRAIRTSFLPYLTYWGYFFARGCATSPTRS